MHGIRENPSQTLTEMAEAILPDAHQSVNERTAFIMGAHAALELAVWRPALAVQMTEALAALWPGGMSDLMRAYFAELAGEPSYERSE